VKKIFLIVSVLINANVFSQEETNDSTQYKPVELPAGFTAQLNVVYVAGKDWNEKMDIYLPPKDNKPNALLINIHGGGWNHGVKESQTGFNLFFKAGFAVANIEYRLTGQATAPAAVEDARCALACLIRNSAALNIDINKIVIMGSSAGGHLALMAGMLGNDHRFDSSCSLGQSMKVAAIIDKYGITDVWDWGYGKDKTSKSAINWLGGYSKDSIFARSVSPINYVSKNNPPVFIVHGDADPTVPYQQSVAFHKKLKDAGVAVKFITVPGGLHGKFSKEQNAEINKAIIVFLKELGLIN